MKNFVFFLFVLISFKSFSQQNQLPLEGTPTNKPLYLANSSDRVVASKIMEARKGADGNWYCLVKFDILSFDSSRKPVSGMSNVLPGNITLFRSSNELQGGVFAPADLYSNTQTGYYYDPNDPSRNSLIEFKAFIRYIPTGEDGNFIWIKANYESSTEVGVGPYFNGPVTNAGNSFDFIYPIVYMKGGKLDFYYVKWGAFKGGGASYVGEGLKVNLKIRKPI
ncbi:hypothetical protein [Sphingobacterium ginsenosidimutans]|uniref:Uncharacterized protein n=1 Tax=Sphingobacterium ginsenosidimutans TaxID=687845 RepID=A0ABP8AFY0_9SPHI